MLGPIPIEQKLAIKRKLQLPVLLYDSELSSGLQQVTLLAEEKVKEKIPSITTANVELVISGVIAMIGNNNER